MVEDQAKALGLNPLKTGQYSDTGASHRFTPAPVTIP